MKKLLAVFALIAVVVGGLYAYNTQSPNNTTSRSYKDSADEPQVYAYDAQSAEDCLPDETFDEQTLTCNYTCENGACEADESAALQDLDTWADEEQKDTEPVAEKKPASNETTIVAQYNVLPTENLQLKSGDDTKDARDIWQTISLLSPDSFTDKYIETYELVNDPETDTLAYVEDADQNGKWLISVNLAGHKASTSRERAATLIHELTHIITLNTSQLDKDVPAQSCTTYHTGDEGCTNQTSYLNQFVSAFWSKADLEANAKEASESGSSLYEKKQDSFITEYASTNPIEDAAESYSFFVLDQKSNEQTVAAQKQNFFYKFNELVELRANMRKALVGYIVREKMKAKQ